ncbi:MAG: hypothetical protein R3272_15425, partial [Candidatus Promineifilaceae bacterium]|nr:hypothetical protein [Candidatus Promineifilaceae bacterium]
PAGSLAAREPSRASVLREERHLRHRTPPYAVPCLTARAPIRRLRLLISSPLTTLPGSPPAAHAVKVAAPSHAVAASRLWFHVEQ